MSNDTINVQRGIVGAGSGDDTYVLSASLIDANAKITITDVEGTNKIQLIGGLTIASSQVAGNTTELTLSNGAVVTILGASTMSYEVGGNPLAGTPGVTKDYATFAQDVLGTNVPTEGIANGGASTVNENGTANPVDPVDPTDPTDPELPTEEPTDPELPTEEPTDPELPTEEPTEPPVDGETFTLTTGADNFAGTVENDSITGSINTLTPNDRIVDESTTDSDSLSVELLGGLPIPSSVEIKNIEKMNFNVLSGTATIDAGNYSGYKTITAEGTGELTLTNLNDKSAELAVKGNASLSATHSPAAVAAANDAINVTLDSVTGGTVTIGTGVETVNLTTAGAAATLGNFIGTSVITVAIKGGQGFTLGTPATGFINAITIDAREAGKATFTSSAVAPVAVLTGTADDTVTRTVADFAAADLFNLGAGNDTLVMNVATTDTNQASFVGVDNIVFKIAASEIDMAKADQAAALTFEGGGAIIADNLASGSTVTSTKLAAAAVTVDFRDTVMGEATTVDLQEGTSAGVTLVNVKDATINYGKASAAATITLDSSVDGTEVTTDLTVNAKGALTALTLATASELKNLTINAEAAVAAVAQTVNKLETLEVNNTSNAGVVTLAGVAAANTAGLTSVKLDATGGAITTTGAIANSGAIKDVTISGSKDVIAVFTSTAANVDKVVSTATGNTTITITSNGTTGEAGSTVTLGDAALGKSNILNINLIPGVGTGTDTNNTVTGGTGVDNITIGSAGADTINAGAGDDVISVAGGANNLTGGAGADTFTFTGGVSAATAAALAAKHTVITDFKGLAFDKDVIDFTAVLTAGKTVVSGSVVSANGLITDFGTNASTTLAQKIDVAAAIAVAADEAVAFVHEGKSYLFVEGTAANAVVDVTDTLIELTGVSLSDGFELSGGDIINFA